MGLTINSMVVALVVCFGLFIVVVANSITSLGGYYDTTGYNETQLDSYNHLDSLHSRINSSSTAIEQVNVDKGIFDWFAGLWEKLKSPFTFTIQSYKTLNTVTNQASDNLQLMPEFKQAIGTIILLLVVVGILAGRYFLGRR